MSRSKPKRPKQIPQGRCNASATASLPPLVQLCQSPDDFLDKLDVATLNLMCATGLPGSENIDVPKMLDWLDEAARKVEFETRRHWYRFTASPGTYNNSPGYFCCYFLLQVLQEDCGVKYNPERATDPTWQGSEQEPKFLDSRDIFIHGIIDGPGGTCGSMPVVYLAVGRRLGYPLKFVEAKGHLFLRWDDPLGKQRGVPERFNIDGAGYGIASHSDDHYRTWPREWNDAEKKANLYLRSLTPREELKAFVVTRAQCLEDLGRYDEAIQAYRLAAGLVPHDPRPRNNLRKLIWELQSHIFEIQEVIECGRQARNAGRSRPLGIAPLVSPAATTHGPNCGCAHCQRQRKTIPAQAPWHPAGCGCVNCQKALAAAGQRVAGHPNGCGCHRCNSLSRMNRRIGSH